MLLETFLTANAATAQAQLKPYIGQTQIIFAQPKADGSISLRAAMTAAELDALDGVLRDFGYGLEY